MRRFIHLLYIPSKLPSKLPAVLAAVLAVVLTMTSPVGCNRSSGGSQGAAVTYRLDVTLGQGVEGTPGTGSYTYKAGTEVSYAFTLNHDRHDLIVTVNQTPVETSGTFVMDGDKRLTAAQNRSLKNVLQVRTPQSFRDAGDVRWFFEMIADYKVDAVEMTVKQDEDDEYFSGHVFYDSAVAPIAAGYENFDALRAVILEAHSRGIKVYAWVPQFHDKAAIDMQPHRQMTAYVNGNLVPYTGSKANRAEYFVNPFDEGVKDYELSIIAEVAANYDIDGLFLDWVRFDNWNMDLSAASCGLYHTISGVDATTIDFSTDNAQRRAWNEWRREVIADFIAKAKDRVKTANPSIAFGVHVLPPEFEEVAQDPRRIGAHADIVSPMAYWDDWGYAKEWTWKKMLLQTVEAVDENKMMPDLDTDWSNDDTATVVYHIKIYYPRVNTLFWFRYGGWNKKVMEKIRNANPEI